MEFAALFGCQVNIGKLRGEIRKECPDECRNWIREGFARVCAHADPYGVLITLEPQNRTVINSLNTTREGLAFVREMNLPNLMLMVDIYHMKSRGPLDYRRPDRSVRGPAARPLRRQQPPGAGEGESEFRGDRPRPEGAGLRPVRLGRGRPGDGRLGRGAIRGRLSAVHRRVHRSGVTREILGTRDPSARWSLFDPASPRCAAKMELANALRQPSLRALRCGSRVPRKV